MIIFLKYILCTLDNTQMTEHYVKGIIKHLFKHQVNWG